MQTEKQAPSYKEGVKELVTQLRGMLPAESLQVFDKDASQLAQTYRDPLKVKVGSKAPLFTLHNATGKAVDLSRLLKDGPVILTFYRGMWCPYCNLQLNAYQQILPSLTEAGARLVAISPQTPDASLSIAEKNQLRFEVLSDPGNKVARQYTTVFKNADAAVAEMAKLGIDFDSFYEDRSHELPVPAVFIIDREGMVRFAKAESGDYRQRVEPLELLEALENLKNK